MKTSASGREAALNICGGLCVEAVRKARFEGRCRRMDESQVEDRPDWRARREARRIPPEESMRTFQEDPKRYHDDCGRRDFGRCARCNLWS